MPKTLKGAFKGERKRRRKKTKLHRQGQVSKQRPGGGQNKAKKVKEEKAQGQRVLRLSSRRKVSERLKFHKHEKFHHEISFGRKPHVTTPPSLKHLDSSLESRNGMLF